MKFEENAKREEMTWRQRSRALWLKEGDKNSIFFQRTANCYKRCSNIDKLNINGSIITEPAEIRAAITNFYQELYTETSQRPHFNPGIQPMISEEDNALLQGQLKNTR